MISEEMLKKAAAEADQAIRDSLPAPAECKHEFSPSFQRNQSHCSHRAQRPVMHPVFPLNAFVYGTAYDSHYS